MKNLIQNFILINTVASVYCWQYFTSLADLTLTNSAKETKHVHSEYIYGNCKNEKKQLYTHVYLDHMDVLGKVIIRMKDVRNHQDLLSPITLPIEYGWVDIPRIPTCIILRGTGYEEDTFRSTTFPFQLCVPRITYCHTKRIFKYFYYEWYIPNDKFIGGMNWDIFMYGSSKLSW